MRSFLYSLPILASLTTSLPALADTQPNIICGLIDTDDNRLSYAFAPNSPASGPNKIGSLTEVGYSRNKVTPPYKDGKYPVWSFQLLDNGITIITPQDTPNYKMIFSVSIGGKFPVVLMHGSSLRASGDCIQIAQGQAS